MPDLLGGGVGLALDAGQLAFDLAKIAFHLNEILGSVSV